MNQQIVLNFLHLSLQEWKAVIWLPGKGQPFKQFFIDRVLGPFIFSFLNLLCVHWGTTFWTELEQFSKIVFIKKQNSFSTRIIEAFLIFIYTWCCTCLRGQRWVFIIRIIINKNALNFWGWWAVIKLIRSNRDTFNFLVGSWRKIKLIRDFCFFR